MKVHLFPQKDLGRWAVGLMALFFLTMYLKFIPFGGRGLPYLPLPTPVIAVLAVTGGILGIIAVMKRDRAILTILTAVLGILVMLWIGAEFAFPH